MSEVMTNNTAARAVYERMTEYFKANPDKTIDDCEAYLVTLATEICGKRVSEPEARRLYSKGKHQS